MELWCSVTMPTLLAAPFLLFEKLLFLLVRKYITVSTIHWHSAGFLKVSSKLRILLVGAADLALVNAYSSTWTDLPSCRLTLARLAAVMTGGRVCDYLLIIRS